MPSPVLDKAARDQALQALPHWRLADDGATMVRTIEFDTFVSAFAFMTRVALLAEKADHHPDWSNSYGTVSIALSTHSAGGITQKDVDLAKAIEATIG